VTPRVFDGKARFSYATQPMNRFGEL
jgi:hypothetical protein